MPATAVYQKKKATKGLKAAAGVIVGRNEAVGETSDFEERRYMKVCKGASVPGVECKYSFPSKHSAPKLE